MARKADKKNFENACTFESTTKNVLLRGALTSLYDSDKWEFSRWNRSTNSHDPRYKDHKRR